MAVKSTAKPIWRRLAAVKADFSSLTSISDTMCQRTTSEAPNRRMLAAIPIQANRRERRSFG
jgi:hypothetical protein